MTGLPDPSHSRAVLVGAGSYRIFPDLPAVPNNVLDLADELCDERVWGLARDHVVQVKHPTSQGDLLDPVQKVASEATDTLLLYYAGHGLIEGVGGDLHLGILGSSLGKPHTSVPYQHIRDAVWKSKARCKAVILDCCYSGRALGVMSDDKPKTVAAKALIDGTFILVAADENRTAIAPPGEKYTAFTGALLNIIRNGIPEAGELLSLEVIYQDLWSTMVARGLPEPQRVNRNQANQLTLIRNRAYRPRTTLTETTPPGNSSRPAETAGGLPARQQELGSVSTEPAVEPRSATLALPDEWRLAKRNANTPDELVTIGLWGATSSGKTTLLAALGHVVGDIKEHGSWRINGTDRTSQTFLVQHKKILVNNRRFPAATEVPSGPLSFRFSGRGEDGIDTEFLIHVQDLPGGYFADGSQTDVDDVVRRLAECDGLVYLFDPVKESSEGDNDDYIFGMIHRIATYLEEQGRPPGRYLPHRIAVCVTKFDAPKIFLPARAALWGTQDDDEYRFPRISAADAYDFFRWSCQHFGNGRADRIRELIGQNFDPDRTHYFVTSAIGFHLPPDRVFDPNDFVNVEDNAIRGEIRPINVLEPFIVLERELRGEP